MSAKLEMGGIYRTQVYGDDMWKKRVFIPVEEFIYQGDHYHLQQYSGKRVIIGLHYYMGGNYDHVNTFLSTDILPVGQEMVTKIRNKNKIYKEIFDLLFSGGIRKIEDKYGYLK